MTTVILLRPSSSRSESNKRSRQIKGQVSEKNFHLNILKLQCVNHHIGGQAVVEVTIPYNKSSYLNILFFRLSFRIFSSMKESKDQFRPTDILLAFIRHWAVKSMI